jgi:4-phosphopantoate--beta-alanine ligase
MGKKTIAIDLNPMSRTSLAATVTIVDEVTRALPEICHQIEDLQGDSDAQMRAIEGYDRDENLAKVMETMSRNLGRLSES